MGDLKIEGKSARPAGVYRPQTHVRVYDRAIIGRFPQFMLRTPKPAARISNSK